MTSTSIVAIVVTLRVGLALSGRDTVTRSGGGGGGGGGGGPELTFSLV